VIATPSVWARIFQDRLGGLDAQQVYLSKCNTAGCLFTPIGPWLSLLAIWPSKERASRGLTKISVKPLSALTPPAPARSPFTQHSYTPPGYSLITTTYHRHSSTWPHHSSVEATPLASGPTSRLQVGPPGLQGISWCNGSVSCRWLSARLSRRLWSADIDTCCVPRINTRFRDRSFAAAGP